MEINRYKNSNILSIYIEKIKKEVRSMSYQKPQVLAENPKKILSMARCWSSYNSCSFKGY